MMKEGRSSLMKEQGRLSMDKSIKKMIAILISRVQRSQSRKTSYFQIQERVEKDWTS